MSKSFFEYIGIADVERVHTQFLSWIISKDCKAVDATEKASLLSGLFGADGSEITRIYTERKGIDLVVETTTAVLIVENKLKSSQHSNQLGRYKLTAQELYPDVKKRYYFLTLIGEPCTDSEWQKLTYKKLYECLISLKLKHDSNNTIILEEYLSYLRKLVDVVDDFKTNTKSYDMVFLDGKKKKEDKIDFEYKTDGEKFIAANQLETILQKSYLCSVAEIMEECDVLVTDTRGDALINFTLAEAIKVDGKDFRTIIQLQNDNIKFAFTTADRHYGNSKKNWIQKVIPFMENIARSNDFGYTKVNKPKEKAYVSLSKKVKNYWHQTPYELAAYLREEIEKGRELTTLLTKEIDGIKISK
ncbi:PD-(D/E)XK nuclease family protein [Desertivirga xinjiangensis]|uniref:PD-(D/E)XK nuclease family protein n=1 Tax=Desertivirga xinjiangensis TaxID=539206 RepID=UPI00210D4F98|nr:PD-(D/E)XK nuclease family protein [Pedobacter xinjiangensis]